MSEESNQAPTEWYPAEAKDYISNKGWKAPADVLGAYQSLEKLVTADKAGRTIVLPKDENDAEGMKAFRSKLGVPDAIDGYQIPDAFKDDPLVPEFVKHVHSLGMPAKHLEAVLSWVNDATVAEQQRAEKEQAEHVKKEMDGLRTEWGDKFDAHSELAKRAISTFAKKAGLDDENAKSLAATLESSAPLRKLFAAIGQGLGESNFADGGANSGAQRTLQQRVNTLKEQRMKGTISQAEYLREMEVLGPQMESAA